MELVLKSYFNKFKKSFELETGDEPKRSRPLLSNS